LFQDQIQNFANTGFPFKLAEFLVTENAVIISNTGDVKMYLSEDDAIIIAPDSEAELEMALEKLIQNIDFRHKIAKNGKNKALKYFNPKEETKKIINLLEKL